MTSHPSTAGLGFPFYSEKKEKLGEKVIMEVGCRNSAFFLHARFLHSEFFLLALKGSHFAVCAPNNVTPSAYLFISFLAHFFLLYNRGFSPLAVFSPNT